MDGQTRESGSRYRLVGIRTDGTRTTVLGSMTWSEAHETMRVVEKAGIFTSVYVAVDKGEVDPPPPGHP